MGGIEQIIKDEDGNDVVITVYPDIPVIVVNGGKDENIEDSSNISDNLSDVSAS